MSTIDVTTYGPGGFDPDDPNIVDQTTAEVPPEASNRDLLRDRARQALNRNRDYLQLASPTAAQVRDQVELLTRETSGLIRLLISALDSVDGT